MTPDACRRKALQFEHAAELATDESAQRAYRDLASKCTSGRNGRKRLSADSVPGVKSRSRVARRPPS
jgi:hypothetical protein